MKHRNYRRVLVAVTSVLALAAPIVASEAPAGAALATCNIHWESRSSIYGWAWTDYEYKDCTLMSVRTLYVDTALRGAGWTTQVTNNDTLWHPAPPGSSAFYSTPAGFGNWYGVQVEALDTVHWTWQCYTYHVYPYAEWVQNGQCTYL